MNIRVRGGGEILEQFVMTDEDYQDPGQLSNSSGNFQMYPQ